MQVKSSTGLQSSEVLDIKVFLRTYNDALDCAKSVAYRDA